MVLFGELVIPSSRVLWDDEEEYEQLDNNSWTIEWKGDGSAPKAINKLLIVETSTLSSIALSCMTKNVPVCSLPKANISVYQLNRDDFMIVCAGAKDIIPGEITEIFAPWIKISKRIICVTSNSAATYQTKVNDEFPPCFIKCLKVGKSGDIFSAPLEVPNLVTGICAGVLSYCQHTNLSAVVYTCYTDHQTLDSTSAQPIVELFQKFKMATEKPFVFKPVFKVGSNLYM